MKKLILGLGIVYSASIHAGNGSVIGAIASHRADLLHIEVDPLQFRHHLREAYTTNTVILDNVKHDVIDVSALKGTIKLENIIIKSD